MQTFLPYPDFAESARVLDSRRLGKQRVENLQIMKARFERPAPTSRGWANHPAVVQWSASMFTLWEYHVEICREWTEVRGFKDTTLEKATELYSTYTIVNTRPWWLGLEPFHASHRSNLLRKKPEHYREFWPDEPDDLPYLWPSKLDPMDFVPDPPPF